MHVPQYEGLSIQDILAEAKKNQVFMQHMPDEKEQSKLPKQLIINVASKIHGDVFNEWIKAKITERNEKLAVDKNLMISVDP